MTEELKRDKKAGRLIVRLKNGNVIIDALKKISLKYYTFERHGRIYRDDIASMGINEEAGR